MLNVFLWDYYLRSIEIADYQLRYFINVKQLQYNYYIGVETGNWVINGEINISWHNLWNICTVIIRTFIAIVYPRKFHSSPPRHRSFFWLPISSSQNFLHPQASSCSTRRIPSHLQKPRNSSSNLCTYIAFVNVSKAFWPACAVA